MSQPLQGRGPGPITDMDRSMPNGRDSHRVSGNTLFPEEHSSYEKDIERMDVPYEELAEEDGNRGVEKALAAEPPSSQ